MSESSRRIYHLSLLAITCIFLVWSAINPKDYPTWFLEVVPAIAGAIILVSIYKRFRFTNLVYTLMAIHAVILIIGGHYTYAEVPMFDWIRDTFDLSRNHYDRLGHFAQGFVPAMIAREVILHNTPLKPGKWLFFLVTCFCLAFSAFYEMIEWWTALLSGEAADAFLGSQGDIWDAQWDMFIALCGAILAQLLLSRFHDRLIEFKLNRKTH